MIGERVGEVAAIGVEGIMELSIEDAADICEDIVDGSIDDESIIEDDDAIELSLAIDDDSIADDEESCANAPVASTAGQGRTGEE